MQRKCVSSHVAIEMWRQMTIDLHRFRRHAGGNVVILFALCLVPMLGLLGLAVDYSLTLRAKTALDASTDAAVLAAATEASQIIQTQSTPSYDATATAIYYGTLAGQQVFTANAAMVRTVDTPVLTLQLQRPNNGPLITASGSYSAQWPTVFGKMFGTTAMNIGGRSTSNLNLPKFMNIYVATDISQSMGIAATQADMNNLSKLTNGCVFGCHVKQNGQSQSLTYEQIAHNNSVTLRIDVIKSAIQSMISSAQSVTNGNPTINIGLYTLQERIPGDGANYYNVLSAPTTNYATLKTIANQIDLGPNDTGGTGDSDFANSVNLFASGEVGASGDGTSTYSKQNFVFIMTDGVQDVKGSCVDGHCTKAFDPALCKSLKDKNATVGVIYTTYVPFPNEQTYRDLVAPIQSQIAPNLASCATPGWYYEASDGPAIQNAVNALFAQAISSGKLTQ